MSSSAVLRFNHLHRRLVPEGWWRFDVLIKEEKGIFTKIQLVGEDGEHRRMWAEIALQVSEEVAVACELADKQVSG